jgi:hypothetical protein
VAGHLTLDPDVFIDLSGKIKGDIEYRIKVLDGKDSGIVRMPKVRTKFQFQFVLY